MDNVTAPVLWPASGFSLHVLRKNFLLRVRIPKNHREDLVSNKIKGKKKYNDWYYFQDIIISWLDANQ